MKKISKRLLAVLITVISVISMFSATALSSSAATSGGSSSATVYVTTKANYWYPGSSSITLTQQKQTITYKKLNSSKTKTKTGYYGRYDIKVYNVTKKKTTTVYWKGGKTKTISLDKNCQYQITVKYNSANTNTFTSAPLGYSWKSTSSPSWYVSGKWKVSSLS